jgi:carboxymethylenebutenolidase
LITLKNSIDPPSNEFGVYPLEITIFSVMIPGRYQAENAIFAVFRGPVGVRSRAAGDAACNLSSSVPREPPQSGGRFNMAFRNIQAGMATYRGHGGERGDSYYAHPANAGPHPGVVVIHHMPGWDEWTCEVARKFAHHGYAAVAPSLYFRVGDGADEAVVAKVRESGGIPDDQMLGDVTGAIDFLRSQLHASGKVGVIGFCSGGRQTYLVACKLSHLIQGAVDCWGGNVVVDDKSRLTKAQPVAPVDLTEGINCPLLGLFGNEDPNPTADQVNRTEAELKRLGKNYEFHRYDGAGHAFFAHYRPNYRPEPAVDGWHKVFAFFHKHLGAPRS